MDRAERPFFRSSNTSRLIGFAMIIAGQFFPMGEFNVLGVVFPSNMIQVAGVIMFMWPMGREAFFLWNNRRRSKHDR